MRTESVLQDGRVLEMDGGDGYTKIYLMPLNCTLKNGEDGKFHIMCILIHTQNNQTPLGPRLEAHRRQLDIKNRNEVSS